MLMVFKRRKIARKVNLRGAGSEHHEQVLFVARFRMAYPVFRKLLYAVPNGGRRSKTEAAALKAEGVVPGVPDLFLSVPRGKYHGMYIEMKKALGGRVSKPQADMIKLLEYQGYYVQVCEGAEAAMTAVTWYLSLHAQPTQNST